MLILISTSILLGVASYLVLASRRHKLRPPDSNLISSKAIVDSTLSPEGTVLVNGELWPARSNDNCMINTGSLVKVVGVNGHRLLIEEQQQ